jgi:hypothetical protein
VQADLALRFAGTPARSAEARLLPLSGPDPTEDVLDLRLTTPYVLFGDTGFGLRLPDGLVLYDSASAPPAQHARERQVRQSEGRGRRSCWAGCVLSSESASREDAGRGA